MTDIKFGSISNPLMIALFITISLIIFFAIVDPYLSKKRLQNHNEYGSSKFASLREIKKLFRKENLRNINATGFPVWYEKRNGNFSNVYFDNQSSHYLLIGSTGSGKSATVSIPLALHIANAKEERSVVITDPKGELFQKTAYVFAQNKYNIITLDFRDPSKSTKINVMQPIINEWKKHCYHHKIMMIFLSHFLKDNKISMSKIISNNKKYIETLKEKYLLEDYILDIIKINANEIQKNIKNKKMYEKDILKEYCNQDVKGYFENVDNKKIIEEIKINQNKSAQHQAETNLLVISLSNLIFVEKNTKDPFWINSAKQLFIGIAGIFLEDYKNELIDEKKISISSIKKFQTSSLIKENQTYLQKNLSERPYGNLSRDYLTSILSAAENTYKSITAVFSEKMAIFDDLNVENITSENEFDFTTLATKKSVLYLIIPDEDRAYYQLVTIILGMLIKDLTKFANLPQNAGVLPVKVTWLLDEFANCPPIDAIETTVSVARSRGMNFIFFIQSFAQLDLVYGKETSNIIQDNCALCYLKTNSIECAEVIAKKLGKETIETQSLSMSTDVFKVGGNKTKSLIGKELLTATEILRLQYKTIIFPIVGNPIFRDTYLYSDLYPEFKNPKIYERKTSIFKRITDNYYTVEKLRELYSEGTSDNGNMINHLAKLYDTQMKNTERKKIKKNNISKDEFYEELFLFLENIRNTFRNKISNQVISDDIYTFEINALLNKFEIAKINREKSKNIKLVIGENLLSKKTLLSVWSEKVNENKLDRGD